MDAVFVQTVSGEGAGGEAVFPVVLGGVALARATASPDGIPEGIHPAVGKADYRVRRIPVTTADLLDLDAADAPARIVRLAASGVLSRAALLRHDPLRAEGPEALRRAALHFLDQACAEADGLGDPEDLLGDVLEMVEGGALLPDSPSAFRVGGAVFLAPRELIRGRVVQEDFVTRQWSAWGRRPRTDPPSEVLRDARLAMRGEAAASRATLAWTAEGPRGGTVTLHRGIVLRPGVDGAGLGDAVRYELGLLPAQLRPGAEPRAGLGRETLWSGDPAVARLDAGPGEDGLGVVLTAVFQRSDLAADFTRIHPTSAVQLATEGRGTDWLVVRGDAVPTSLAVSSILASPPARAILPADVLPPPLRREVRLDEALDGIRRRADGLKAEVARVLEAVPPVPREPPTARQILTSWARRDEGLRKAAAAQAAAASTLQAARDRRASGPLGYVLGFGAERSAARATGLAAHGLAVARHGFAGLRGPQARRAAEKALAVHSEAVAARDAAIAEHGRLAAGIGSLGKLAAQARDLQRYGVVSVFARGGQNTAAAIVEAREREACFREEPSLLPRGRLAPALVALVAQGVEMRAQGDLVGEAMCLRAAPALLAAVEAEGLGSEVDALAPGTMARANRAARAGSPAPEADPPRKAAAEAGAPREPTGPRR